MIRAGTRAGRHVLLVIGALAGTRALGPLAVAHGAEGTELASALDEGHPFQLHVGVDYAYESKRTSIKREDELIAGTSPDGNPPFVKDLIYSQTRHLVTPHLELGVFTDVQVSFALPIVISDNREWSFDQGASPCVFPPNPQPTCINSANSTTFNDGILTKDSMGHIGYDAKDPSAGFGADSTTVFRGITRSGIDTMNFGLTWAPLNQKRDDTKPTWVIGGELDISVGKIMHFNRMNPSDEAGVSRGVHELKVFTGLSRRTTWAEPYVFFWWKTPIGVRGTNPDDPNGSLFWDLGFGQTRKEPQQTAGTKFGFEAIPFEDKKSHQKVSIVFGGRIDAHFEGRGYSEMWEPFAYAGDVKNNAAAPLQIDRDPTKTTDTPLSHPGVTDIENYLTFAGTLGLRGELGENARFTLSFDYQQDTRHFITFDNAGVDGPDSDIVVTPGTSEVNPLHKPIVDLAGRRYLADDSSTYTLFLSGQILF